jgi:hypothetical protein
MGEEKRAWVMKASSKEGVVDFLGFKTPKLSRFERIKGNADRTAGEY